MNREIRRADEKTIAQATEEYEVYLRDEKQNKERSYTATLWRLGVFFPDQELCLSALTSSKCAAYYAALRNRTTKYGKPLATDSHRNILAEAKTFLKWSVGKGYFRSNPLEGVEGTGKRRHGKPQLRIDEARRWQAKAMQLADDGEAGAIAALRDAGDGASGGRGGEPGRSRSGRRGTVALDSGLEDGGGEANLAGAGSPQDPAAGARRRGRRRTICCSATTIETGRGSGWPRSARRRGCRG